MQVRLLLVGGLLCFLPLLVWSRSAQGALPGERLVDLPASGGLQLAVKVRVTRDSLGRRATRGLLTLTIPLDRMAAPSAEPQHRGLAAPPAPQAESHPQPNPPDAPPDSPSQATPAPDGSSAQDHGPSRPGEPAQASVPLAPTLDPDLCRRTVEAAVRAAGFGSSARRLSSLSSRVRTSAALPELRLRGGRATDESLRLTPTSADPYRYTEAGESELFFEVRMTWKLDRLLYSEAELSVERLRRDRAKAKAELVERVLHLLFVRERARTRLAVVSLLPEERVAAALEQLEAEVMLDVYTAGWFSLHVWTGPADGSDNKESTASRPP